jgi:hypothetical protein
MSRNFRAIVALPANCSIELRERVALYRFPLWTVNSAAKLKAVTKVAAIANAAKPVSELRRVLLVMANVLSVPLLEPASGARLEAVHMALEVLEGDLQLRVWRGLLLGEIDVP